MTRSHTGRAPRAGFTVIEVLVTLLIMSMILVSVTQILTGARMDRDEIHNIQERQLVGPAVLQRLERDLRGLLTYNRGPRDAIRIRDLVTSGLDADTIDFVTTTDSLLPYRENPGDIPRRADVNEVGYRLRPRPGSDDFLELYRREGFGVDDEPFEGGRFSLLADQVKGLNIEVYEEDGPEAEPVESWGTTADEYSGLPTRIDVELTIELAPRLVREQLVSDRRTVTYKRIIRFPESVRATLANPPVPAIPVIEPPAPDPGVTGPGASGGEAGTGEPTTQVITSDQAGVGGGGDNPFGGGGER